MRQVRMPSKGFWLLVVVTVLVGAYFVWGFSTPRLDRVWAIEQGLKTGIVQSLSDSEKELLYDVFEDYPAYLKDIAGRRGIDLISANSDGLSLSTNELILVRSEVAKTCDKFTLDVSGQNKEFPIEFLVTGRTWSKKIKSKQSGKVVVWLPKSSVMPELIEVRRNNNNGEIGAVDVKVRFCE